MGRKLFLLESLKLKKGDTFEFGAWKGQPIEWQVVNIGSGILCVSKYCLESRRFDEESDAWKNSELRQWLNSDFYSRAFTSEEKSFMLPYENDKVTLLSTNDLNKYFRSNSDLKAFYKNGRKAEWWIRQRVVDNNKGYIAAFVDSTGHDRGDYKIEFDIYSVRPAILLKKEVEEFLEPEEV